MAGKVCSNCGYKNKSTEIMCVQCGNYLEGSSPVVSQAESTPASVTENAPQEQAEEESRASESPRRGGTTITIKNNGNKYKYIPIAISAAIVLVYIGLDMFVTQLPIELFFVFLLMIFIVPSIVRNSYSPVKFSTRGFSVPGSDTGEEFYYQDIDKATYMSKGPGEQLVILSMGKGDREVTFDFEHVYPMRLFLTQLNRRRIPISAENGPSSQ